MPDDESLKAFENEMRRQLHRVVKDKDGLYVAARTHEKWVLWQAAVEWATRRYEVVLTGVAGVKVAMFSPKRGWYMLASIDIDGLMFALFVHPNKWRGLAEEPK